MRDTRQAKICLYQVRDNGGHLCYSRANSYILAHVCV